MEFAVEDKRKLSTQRPSLFFGVRAPEVFSRSTFQSHETLLRTSQGFQHPEVEDAGGGEAVLWWKSKRKADSKSFGRFKQGKPGSFLPYGLVRSLPGFAIAECCACGSDGVSAAVAPTAGSKSRKVPANSNKQRLYVCVQ